MKGITMKNSLLKNSFSNSSGYFKYGYLLVEGMMSMIICVLGIWLITTTIWANNHDQQNQTLNFYSCVQLLESDHYQFEVCEVKPDWEVVLYSPKTRKYYHFQKYSNMLRLTGDRKGHLRSLTDVHYVHFEKKEGCLQTRVIFNNGEKYVAYSRLEFKK